MHLLEDNAVAMDDEKLICEVKEHPCLYNTQIADYKIRLKKENAWKAVSAALGQNISGSFHEFSNVQHSVAVDSLVREGYINQVQFVSFVLFY